MPSINVLVVDDQYKSFQPELDKLPGFAFTYLDSFEKAAVLANADYNRFPVLLLDIIGPTGELGLELFQKLGEEKSWLGTRGRIQIVFFSNEPSARRHATIGRARRVDVSGFIDKKDLFDEKPEAMQVLKRAANLASMYKDFPLLADPELRKLSDLVFSPNSHAMHDVWRQIVMAGRCHENVFISGETGTGKELVAKAVYRTSRTISDYDLKEERRKTHARGYNKFFPLNIAALPAEGNLQYVELFGAEKESFGGCNALRKGLFEVASQSGRAKGKPDNKLGGTIFLDEIGDAVPIVQVALLRVLQEKVIMRLGGWNSDNPEIPVVFRLITASHSLLTKLDEGSFREDLYYRLNGLHIHVPPLRERIDDIGILVQCFIDNLNKEYKDEGWEPIEIGDAEALVRKLSAYHWRGNVRELEMAIRASYVTTIGNTFKLSEEVERRMAGLEPSPRANVEEILASLRQRPMPIIKIAEIHGALVAIDVYRALCPAGHRLGGIIAQQYFGPKANGEQLRKWVERKEGKLPRPLDKP